MSEQTIALAFCYLAAFIFLILANNISYIGCDTQEQVEAKSRQGMFYVWLAFGLILLGPLLYRFWL